MKMDLTMDTNSLSRFSAFFFLSKTDDFVDATKANYQ